MVIQLDRCYRILFKTTDDGAGADFSVLNGFYEVVRSYGWNELNGAGVDLQKNLLDLAGIVDSSALRTLQQNWTNDAFYYCIGMDQDRQVWVPESIIKGYPDPRIGSYKKLGLVLELGVFANAEDFSTMGEELVEHLKSNYGIEAPKGTVTVYGNQWLTNQDFEAMDVKRKSLQGLVHVKQTASIPASDSLITTVITFDTPVILSKENEEIIRGAISDSISILYGLDFGNIPSGSVDSTTPCWYYTDDDILANNTEIEQALNINFNAVVLGAIRVKSKFQKTFYAWNLADKTVYTEDLNPVVGDRFFSDYNLINDAGVISAVTMNETDTSRVDSFADSSSTPIVYTKNDSVNATSIRISYRCRNSKVLYKSPLSEAIHYAYENIRLRQRIAALEELVTG